MVAENLVRRVGLTRGLYAFAPESCVVPFGPGDRGDAMIAEAFAAAFHLPAAELHVVADEEQARVWWWWWSERAGMHVLLGFGRSLPHIGAGLLQRNARSS